MAGLQELSTKYGGEFHGAVLRSLAPLTNREAGMESAWQLQNRPGIVTVCAVPYTADPPVQYASLDRAGSHAHRKWAEAGLSVSAQVAPVQENQDLGARGPDPASHGGSQGPQPTEGGCTHLCVLGFGGYLGLPSKT